MYTSAASDRLVRRLGLWSSIGIVIGVTIGSGIFRTPAAIAARVPDPGWMLAVWLIGGLISLCGALSVAELAASLPQTGGWYVYLREGWGRLAGFLFGWSELVLIRASASGAIATVFSEYFLRSLGVRPRGTRARPPITLPPRQSSARPLLNIRGVRVGAALAGTSTVAKFGALVLLVAAPRSCSAAAPARLGGISRRPARREAGLLRPRADIRALGLRRVRGRVVAAGEVRDPQRNLPRAIVVGTIAIITIYLAAKCAYLT